MLVLVGAIHQQNVDIPNQEILLQLNSDELTLEDSQTAIQTVERGLNSVGVKNFKVNDNGDGVFKITYYSDADVEVVKRLLTQKIRSELDTDEDDIPFELPSDQDALSYNLDVYEIHEGSDADSGLNGIAVTETNHKADRFSKPKHTHPSLYITSNEDYLSLTVGVKFNRYNVFTLQNTDQKIPEVRAGPLS